MVDGNVAMSELQVRSLAVGGENERHRGEMALGPAVFAWSPSLDNESTRSETEILPMDVAAPRHEGASNSRADPRGSPGKRLVTTGRHERGVGFLGSPR